MPFGLMDAPATFQCFMNDIFNDLLDICVLVYLDNTLIYSKTLHDHRKHVPKVLGHLHKHGLYACTDKCEWDQTEVKFLGYIISQN